MCPLPDRMNPIVSPRNCSLWTRMVPKINCNLLFFFGEKWPINEKVSKFSLPQNLTKNNSFKPLSPRPLKWFCQKFYRLTLFWLPSICQVLPKSIQLPRWYKQKCLPASLQYWLLIDNNNDDDGNNNNNVLYYNWHIPYNATCTTEHRQVRHAGLRTVKQNTQVMRRLNTKIRFSNTLATWHACSSTSNKLINYVNNAEKPEKCWRTSYMHAFELLRTEAINVSLKLHQWSIDTTGRMSHLSASLCITFNISSLVTLCLI